MAPLCNLTLGQYVEAVGEDRPSPGCGSAAAASLALAAACARKALAISARHRDGDAALQGAADRCRILAKAALSGLERDAENFEAMLKAPDDADERARVLEGDAQVLIALAAELRALIERHGPSIAPVVSGDSAAALALVRAFEDIQTRNLLEV